MAEFCRLDATVSNPEGRHRGRKFHRNVSTDSQTEKNGFNRITIISNDKINRMVTIVPFGDVMPYRVRI